MGAPTWDPIGPQMDIFGSSIRLNWYGTYLEMLIDALTFISTKFQPEWTIPSPFQSIFDFGEYSLISMYTLGGSEPGSCMDLSLDPAWISTWSQGGSQPVFLQGF